VIALGCSPAPAPVDASIGDAGDPLDGLAICEGGVLAWTTLARIEPLARDTDTYRPPPEAMRAGIAAAIAAIAAGDATVAIERAADASYVVCRGEGEEAGLALLRPSTAGTGHATIVIRASGAGLREVILEAPHPVFDVGTLEESVAIFTRISARALLASGTHRCASARPSGCDGVADACGPDAPVRESDMDMAHAVDSTFQAAHVALADTYPATWIVSVHGFEGAGVSVSNGTTGDARLESRVARLARTLTFALDDVTACNATSDPDVIFAARLCGTTNVQGRALHGSAAACTEPAARATDRFVHLEQSRDVRETAASTIADALAEVIDAR
jgi:hypothetical protein